jgi:Holliday junction resolvase RusA-like endonuclease
VVSVPVPSPYPSVNHTGRDSFRGGRKSPSYRKLFEAVLEEAQHAADRCGWVMARRRVRCWITRYKPSPGRADASNVGKAEGDGLTAAGIWEDDSLARPITLDIVYDPSGPDRIVIVVQQLSREPEPEPVTAPAPPRKHEADRMDADEFRRQVKAGNIRGVRL